MCRFIPPRLPAPLIPFQLYTLLFARPSLTPSRRQRTPAHDEAKQQHSAPRNTLPTHTDHLEAALVAVVGVVAWGRAARAVDRRRLHTCGQAIAATTTARATTASAAPEGWDWESGRSSGANKLAAGGVRGWIFWLIPFLPCLKYKNQAPYNEFVSAKSRVKNNLNYLGCTILFGWRHVFARIVR